MRKNVYSKTIVSLYKELKTNKSGLSSVEAKRRLEIDGENKLREPKEKSKVLKFFEQFNDFIIILLILAAIFSAIVSYIRQESLIDSIIIIVIVIINAIISFVEEQKADTAIQSLNKMFITKGYVIRDGKRIRVDVRNIVVGDIIELSAGDYISADARIIESSGLEVNESMLSGEFNSIKKNSEIVKNGKKLYDNSNIVFSGCSVINGHALALVYATGMDTEIGKIANSLSEKKFEMTPLQEKVKQVSKILTYIVLLIISVMMIMGLIMKYDFFDILMISISLAVAAVPEGISSVITIILSIGMAKMAKENVIMRKMSSIELLGSTDVICSDKTGTITENKLAVKCLFDNNNQLYSINDNVLASDMLLTCARICHNVVKNKSRYLGDETEVAIVKYLDQINYNIGKVKRIKEYPFDSERKMMSVRCQLNGNLYSFTKGSTGVLLANSSYYLENGKKIKITNEYVNKVLKIEKELSLKSLRVLSFAYKDNNSTNPERNMIFLGLIGLIDPPRKNVHYAISACLKSGIKPIMITGDSINTAIAISKEVGIMNDVDRAIDGAKIDRMTDEELKIAVNYYQVYARVSHNTKIRIINALQSCGLIVAMTGDGVNDALAIKAADIGIGMGKNGAEVIKKIADCILVDDSFTTIVTGIFEGRRISSNIRKVILYLLAGNIVEVMLVFISMLLNMEMFSTLQLLWLNFITDSIPAIMLAFEKGTEDRIDNTMDNRYNDSFFTPFLSARIFIGAFIKSFIMLGLFVAFAKIIDVGTASSLMFIYLITHELLFAYSCKNTKFSILNRRIFDNKYLNLGILGIVMVHIIVFLTNLKKYFIVQSIDSKYILITIGICIFMFIVGELVKPIYSKLFKDYLEV